MQQKTKEITQYFRSAVAAQSNAGIDFKDDKFYIISPEELTSGKISSADCKQIFTDANKSTAEDESEAKQKNRVNVIICAKAIKTIYAAAEQVQDEIPELTDLLYSGQS